VLNQIGYDGWLTIESFAKPEPDLAAAAAIWRDMAPSGDELAKGGIGFIKKLAGELKSVKASKKKSITKKKKASSRQ
jgi:hypothetical protein